MGTSQQSRSLKWTGSIICAVLYCTIICAGCTIAVEGRGQQKMKIAIAIILLTGLVAVFNAKHYLIETKDTDSHINGYLPYRIGYEAMHPKPKTEEKYDVEKGTRQDYWGLDPTGI